MKNAPPSNSSVEEVTEQASTLDISELAQTPVSKVSRSRKTKAYQQDHGVNTEGLRRSPRLLQKRVRSTVNQVNVLTV